MHGSPEHMDLAELPAGSAAWSRGDSVCGLERRGQCLRLQLPLSRLFLIRGLEHQASLLMRAESLAQRMGSQGLSCYSNHGGDFRVWACQEPLGTSAEVWLKLQDQRRQ